MAATKPVILLAFANDPADGIHYLRNLPEEARRVRAALEAAEAQGLCEFELRYNATLDDILAAFQHPKLRGRIAVFHYGGHADSFELLLQSPEGNLQRIDGRGFGAFLAEQRSLQLVFLNACTTEPQIESLLSANVQVVIATSQEVDDGVASALASLFYQQLARGDSIGSAYRQAVAALRAQKGDDPTLFYMLGGGPSPGEIAAAEQPPDSGAESGGVGSGGAESGGIESNGTESGGTGADQGQGGVAEARVNTAGTSTGGLSTGGAAKAPGSEVGGSTSGGFWPWLLRTRPGAETAIEWSLPQAAGDPLFGLPLPPQRPLPESPYQRGLDYYTRDLAELFFGRSRQIRELYQRITAAGHANVILYYGQSGVGKSSLLDAGVAPRLEGTHNVSYARRDRGLGLLGTLRKQLAGAAATPAENAPAATGSDAGALGRTAGAAGAAGAADSPLAEAWLAAEQAGGKPLVLILDQVEEAFTRRNPDRPQELEEFAAALRSLDGGARRPQGALVLGFRKEHLAEIVSALRKESVAYVGQFLAPLDGEGIQEVLWGPVRSDRLRGHYGLTLDADLPEQIAHDLTADPDSPVAPTLNILLRKLWAAAKAQSASTPHFSSELYAQLRRDGILLDDFLRQQRLTLAQEQPQAVASGLLLDLWAFHTTALGTSDQRDEQELQAAYGHQPLVDVLITRSKELYVLADPPGDNPTEGTRLAHDTLAPLVRRDYDQSTLPGQQAQRILESRAIDWQGGNTGALLDDAALAVVDKGLQGTRNLTPDEQRLLDASREEQVRRKRRRRLWQIGAAAAAVLLLAMFVLTTQAQLREQETLAKNIQIAATATIAVANEQVALAQATASALSADNAQALGQVERLRNQLVEQRRIQAESQRLAQLSQQQLAEDPVLSLHLALKAMPPATAQLRVPEAEYALRQAVLTSRERTYIPVTYTPFDRDISQGSGNQVAVRGNRLAVGGPSPKVYSLGLRDEEWSLPKNFTDIQGLRWGSDGRLLGWGEDTVWVVSDAEPLRLDVPPGPGQEVRCAEWQPGQEWVAVCTYNTLYAWQPQSGRLITVTEELDEPEIGTVERGVTWSSDGRLLGGRGAKLAVWDSKQPSTPAQVFYETPDAGQALTFAFWLPDDRSLLAGSFPPLAGSLDLQLWNADSEGIESIAVEGDFSDHLQVRAVYAPDPQDGTARLLLWSGDGLLALYTPRGELLAQAEEVGDGVNGVALSPDGERLATYSNDGSAAVWGTRDLGLITRYDASTNFVALSLDNAIWVDNETLVLADASGLVQVVHGIDADALPSITRLPGYGPNDHLVEARRLSGGRLLTGGYAEDGGASSLRIWQADALATEEGEGLPSAADPLCRRLHRSLAVPQGLGRPTVVDWQAEDVLIVTDDLGQVARWQPPGEPAILPVDDLRYETAFAPDYSRVLRYGGGTDGEIWRVDTEGWSLERTVEGEFEAARWTPHGLLIGLSEGAFLFDVEDGGKRPLPDGANVRNSYMPTEDRLLLMRGEDVEVWAVGGKEPLAAWEIPPGRSLDLADVSADGRLYVLRDALFAQTYVLRLQSDALVEVWRSERAHVNVGPALLHPTEPLLATVDDGDISLVDLQSGDVVWQSTSAVAVADHQFSTVRWITGGQYLVTQAQLPRESSIYQNVGVWRWDAAPQQLILLQQTPSSGLLGVDPQAQAVLAGEQGQEQAVNPLYYPLLLDAGQLQRDVQEPCLLDRPLSDEQRQAFSVVGR